MKTIRWGIIGCGKVTEIKSGPALQGADGSELVAVMRRSGDLAANYAKRHGVARWYDDADALINDSQVDAVYVATPPSSHKDYALAVAAASKPVYVEKPMALNFAECQAMIAACEEHKVPLFVAYYRRGLPRFAKVKSLLDDGAIGNVRFAQVCYYRPPSEGDLNGTPNWRVDPRIAGGGYFYDLASHCIDLLQHLLGDAVAASGYASNQTRMYEAEDIVSGVFITEKNVHVNLVWNFNAASRLDRIEIIGSKGTLTFSTFADNPIVLENAAGRQEFTIDNPPHIQQPLIQTIVNELRSRGRCPSTGKTAAQTNWVMQQMCTAL
ncbi:MAG: Gfo/Idh/MocA family oxidoreductase [Planctomycetota bacterium]